MSSERRSIIANGKIDEVQIVGRDRRCVDRDEGRENDHEKRCRSVEAHGYSERDVSEDMSMLKK